ncbi:helix-turn-helix domain-containing protein [Cohnella rhizosphaerae]|uniref:helix-turn-helix domain-containing protein n=1 Tax=Cohnella rhizosphaerae TaxID=1457232 RepID=UPI003B8A5EB1
MRIRFAKSLLLASESSITEICYASGFNTLAHFERVFREKTGMSPIAFRKQADSR